MHAEALWTSYVIEMNDNGRRSLPADIAVHKTSRYEIAYVGPKSEEKYAITVILADCFHR